jgi:hypothetical protein
LAVTVNGDGPLSRKGAQAEGSEESFSGGRTRPEKQFGRRLTGDQPCGQLSIVAAVVLILLGLKNLGLLDWLGSFGF